MFLKDFYKEKILLGQKMANRAHSSTLTKILFPLFPFATVLLICSCSNTPTNAQIVIKEEVFTKSQNTEKHGNSAKTAGREIKNNIEPAIRQKATKGHHFQLGKESIKIGDISGKMRIPHSSEPPVKEIINLETALQRVWQEHPRVISEKANIDAANATIDGTKTGYYPYLSISAIEASNQDSSKSLNIIQPLWSGGKTSAQVKEAEARRNHAIATLNQTRLDLALDLAETYLDMMQAQEQSLLWKHYLTNLNKLLEIIENRAKSGASAAADIQTAKTRLSQAQAGLAASNASLLRNRSHLQTLLNAPVKALTWPTPGSSLSDTEALRILQKKTELNHPAKQLAQSTIALQAAQAKQAKASFFPELSAQYSKRFEQPRGDFTPDSSVRLVLEYNTSQGLQGLSAYRAAQYRINASMQDLVFAQRDIADTLQSALTEKDISGFQFDAQVEAAQAADKLVASYLRQYKVGLKTWADVLNAHREAHDALLTISNIKRNFWLANTRLYLEGALWLINKEHALPLSSGVNVQ